MVVGGSMLGDQTLLSEKEKEILLNMARAAAIEFMTLGERLSLTEKDLKFWEKEQSSLVEQLGCFVTYRKDDGRLRGCIGTTEGRNILIENVIEYAIHAACHDLRFQSLTVEELHDCEIEITVMGDLVRLTDPSDIKIGTHGLVIEKGNFKGLLLPQMAVEQNWNTDEFLRNTCLRAGFSPNHYPEVLGESDTYIYTFTATVFCDSDMDETKEKMRA